MNFVGLNYLDIAINAGQSLLDFASKLKISNLEYNKAFKEVEGLNIIDGISNSNQEESNYTAVNIELKLNTA